jgi:hypothetical protein
MIPCELNNGKQFILKVSPNGLDIDDQFQEFVNNLQHQKSITARVIMGAGVDVAYLEPVGP